MKRSVLLSGGLNMVVSGGRGMIVVIVIVVGWVAGAVDKARAGVLSGWDFIFRNSLGRWLCRGGWT